MAPETLIVKTTDETFLTELESQISSRYPDCSWKIISTCPYKRSRLRRRYGVKNVLNPFLSYGEFDVDIIWIEDWPSLMGERFCEFLYLLFSSGKVLILSQRYEAPSWARKKLMEFCTEPIFVVNDRVPVLPLFPLIHKRGLPIRWSDQILRQRYKIYRDREIDFYIGLDIQVHSYFMNYAGSHSMIGMNSSGLSYLDWRSFVQLFVTYLRGQLRREWNSLVDYHYEYQNRGNSNSQGSLSRSSHYWNTLTSYGKESFCSLLRGARWWQEA